LESIGHGKNPSAMEKLKDIFEARLIPLNKVWPDIPTED
jgi:hypothetical protein